MLSSSPGAIKRREHSFEMWLVLSPTHTSAQCLHPTFRAHRSPSCRGRFHLSPECYPQALGEISLGKGRLKFFIEFMRCFGTMQSPEIIFIFWIKKYISIICPHLILEALRSLLSNFSKYIFTFPALLGGGHTEYNFNNINHADLYINLSYTYIIKLTFLTLYIFYL